MREHELKTDPSVFTLSWEGLKPWEIRLDDRDFQDGDILILRETVFSGDEMAAGSPLEYTGRVIETTATCKLLSKGYGLSEGWCILTVKEQNRWESLKDGI